MALIENDAMPTTGVGGSGGYIFKPLIRTRVVRIFVSSGNDLLAQRDLFELLIKTVNDAFRSSDWVEEHRFALEIDRWEQQTPKKTFGNPNAEFVRRARAAHLTIVFLHRDLRKGTKEELEAVLEEPTTQLAVIWMKPLKPLRAQAFKDLIAFLKLHENSFLYDETGDPTSSDVFVSMMGVIARVLAEVTNPTRRKELFNEAR